MTPGDLIALLQRTEHELRRIGGLLKTEHDRRAAKRIAETAAADVALVARELERDVAPIKPAQGTSTTETVFALAFRRAMERAGR